MFSQYHQDYAHHVYPDCYPKVPHGSPLTHISAITGLCRWLRAGPGCRVTSHDNIIRRQHFNRDIPLRLTSRATTSSLSISTNFILSAHAPRFARCRGSFLHQEHHGTFSECLEQWALCSEDHVGAGMRDRSSLL